MVKFIENLQVITGLLVPFIGRRCVDKLRFFAGLFITVMGAGVLLLESARCSGLLA